MTLRFEVANEGMNAAYAVDANLYYSNQAVQSSIKHNTAVPSRLSSSLVLTVVSTMDYANNTFRVG